MQARVAFAVLVQIACIAGCSILATNIRIGRLGGILDHDSFSIPVRPNGWIILSQWYASRERKSEAEPIVRQMEEKTAPPPTTVPEEILDRISVKDGARIHIIPIKEIFYLQACGDYVTLFTTSGQHVKEQTMKYFERSLPSPEFVRIHRSYILYGTDYASRTIGKNLIK